MQNVVWLINLYGTPSTPTAFNPDNSLAALAGSLKKAGFKPLIVDLQTLSIFKKLMPAELGQRAAEIMHLARSKALSETEYSSIIEFNDELIRHQLEVVDELAESLVAKARIEKPLFIGFKLYSGEGSVLNRHLAKRMKEKLSIPLVGGGPLARIAGQRYFDKYREFDYLLAGECDHSVVSFARLVLGEERAENVKGLIYRDGSGAIRENSVDIIEDMASLPDPCYDRDVYPSLYEPGEKILSFQLDESRGCPNNCNFCVHPMLNGRRFRVAPVKKIIDQIKGIQKTFGAYGFRFAGSNTPKAFLREFAEEIIRQDIKIMYSCFASINTTDESVIEPLKKSGLAGVFIGVESLDQDILRVAFNKRGQPKDKTTRLVKAFLDAGIFTATSWIFPAPGGTPAARQEMKEFLIEAYGGRGLEEGSAMLIPPGLVPDTAWFKNPEKFGFEIPDPDGYLQGYIDLSFKVYLPAQLMGNWNFKMGGKKFLELSAECDAFREELRAADVPLGLSDDWMLSGKLSGMPIEDFVALIQNCFVTGDAKRLRDLVSEINSNSRAACGALELTQVKHRAA